MSWESDKPTQLREDTDTWILASRLVRSWTEGEIQRKISEKRKSLFKDSKLCLLIPPSFMKIIFEPLPNNIFTSTSLPHKICSNWFILESRYHYLNVNKPMVVWAINRHSKMKQKIKQDLWSRPATFWYKESTSQDIINNAFGTQYITGLILTMTIVFFRVMLFLEGLTFRPKYFRI